LPCLSDRRTGAGAACPLHPILEPKLSLNFDLSRRDILKLAGYGSLAAFLAACTTGSTPTRVTATGGSLTIGNNNSDSGLGAGLAAAAQAFGLANGGTKVTISGVVHSTFPDTITPYLQGAPEDVFTWFSGHRMRVLADKGLITPIDDVWNAVKSNYTEAFATAVRGNDGHVYAVPTDYYPWAVFYRKDVFAQKGYAVPADWDGFKAVCAKMKSDGLFPIAMGESDGWPAQGTFNAINLRLNGYDFHTRLASGKEQWTDSRVTAVFSKWTEITQYYPPDLLSTTWQQAARQLLRKTAGMYVIGLFVSDEFKASGRQTDVDQLDYFPFPDLGTQYDAEKAIDAPIDVYMISKKSPTLSKDSGQAKACLEFLAKGSTQGLLLKQATVSVPTANDADTSVYTSLQLRARELMSSAKKITQLDRDSRSDFAGADGLQSFFKKFLANPQQDLGQLQSSIQSFWNSLPPE
jgi:multiple sugar transport system substrate-binding protein